MVYQVNLNLEVELASYDLPNGEKVVIYFSDMKTIDAALVNEGSSPKFRHEIISTGQVNLDNASSAAEGYLNARFNGKGKKSLGVDTSEAGWLENFATNTQTIKSLDEVI